MEISSRILDAYEMILNFYGIELADKLTGNINNHESIFNSRLSQKGRKLLKKI